MTSKLHGWFPFNEVQRYQGGYLTYEPGSFTRTIAGRGIQLRCRHREDHVYARQTDGSLLIKQFTRGLWIEATLRDTPESRQMIADIEAGTLRGISPRYRPKGTRIQFQTRPYGDGTLWRFVDVDCVELSVTHDPVFRGSYVTLMV